MILELNGKKNSANQGYKPSSRTSAAAERNGGHPMYLQDGVAPQCACAGITVKYPNTKTGRVFIPNTINTRGFLGSHTVKNYGWIFTNLISTQDGYVRPR